ncbi:MAG TPA: RluA family pseudouridine synthase [Cyclobacteriaceae bacterium]|nr:RluA family pseudouridine synthase [Cyclobacteriaceae bacterium]
MIEDNEGEFFEDEEISRFEHQRILVDQGQAAVRIDRFLTDRLAHATRNRVQNAIDEGSVQINGEPTKANYKIKPGDVITVMMEEPKRDFEVLPEEISLDILYEDDSLLIVNKEAGMVVHPAHGNWSGTLVNALAHHFKQLPELPGNSGRPGLVHRIDKDTSGVLVIAKSEKAMTHLARQFFDHSIERTYVALVWGEPKEDQGTIDAHIGRSAKNRKIMDVFPDGSQGKNAVTHWKVLRRLRYVSLVQCNLETGRTHQIRAHMKHIGHPLFNDAVYGGDIIRKGTQFAKYKAFIKNCFELLPRQALHAQSLGFIHPVTKEPLHFESPLPSDMAEVLYKWENYVTYTD